MDGENMGAVRLRIKLSTWSAETNRYLTSPVTILTGDDKAYSR